MFVLSCACLCVCVMPRSPFLHHRPTGKAGGDGKSLVCSCQGPKEQHHHCGILVSFPFWQSGNETGWVNLLYVCRLRVPLILPSPVTPSPPPPLTGSQGSPLTHWPRGNSLSVSCDTDTRSHSVCDHLTLGNISSPLPLITAEKCLLEVLEGNASQSNRFVLQWLTHWWPLELIMMTLVAPGILGEVWWWCAANRCWQLLLDR